MSTDIDRLTELAKEDPKRQFFSIAHLITPEKMLAAFRNLRKEASAGVDGVTYEEYERNAEGEHPPAASAAQRRKVSGATATPGLYPQGKREAEANLDSRPGGQDPAESGGGAAERHL